MAFIPRNWKKKREKEKLKMTRKSGRVFLPRNYCHHDVAPVPLIAPENKKKKDRHGNVAPRNVTKEKKTKSEKKGKEKWKKALEEGRELFREAKKNFPPSSLSHSSPSNNKSVEYLSKKVTRFDSAKIQDTFVTDHFARSIHAAHHPRDYVYIYISNRGNSTLL